MLLFLIFLNFWIRLLVPEWFDPRIDESALNKAKSNGIEISVENLLVDHQHFIFDVLITNESPDPVLIDPASMYYLPSPVKFPADYDPDAMLDYEDKLTKYFVMTEQQVKDLYTHKIQDQRNKSILLGILSAGLIVFDVAMDTKDMNRGEWTSKMTRSANTRKALTTVGLATADILNDQAGYKAWQKREDLIYLDQEILKCGELQPGQSVRGKIFFISSNEQHFRLIVPIGRTDFSFDFREAEPADFKKLHK
jgi:hypothetical protein